MVGFAFNLIFTAAASPRMTFSLIVGAPCVPALALAVVCIFVCPESPRYYMRRGSARFDPEKAYAILRRLRKTEVRMDSPRSIPHFLVFLLPAVAR